MGSGGSYSLLPPGETGLNWGQTLIPHKGMARYPFQELGSDPNSKIKLTIWKCFNVLKNLRSRNSIDISFVPAITLYININRHLYLLRIGLH